MTTIAAIATPLGVGGISVIRLSGPEALQVAGRCFRPFNGEDLVAKPGYTACYGRFLHSDGSVLDDGVVLVYHAPHSYTGEDVAELSCHGGVYVTRQLLRRCLECGAVAAQPGEFTRRAFLNGKMDLTQAESVMEVIGAQNQQSLRTARAQMEGALYRQVVECKDALLELCAYLSAWADYPEEDIPALEESSLLPNMKEINTKFSKLLENYDNGRMLTQGIRTAIVGKPNVGKSTLMNLFSGYQRSIVTDIAGTTRDVVEEQVQLGDLQLLLSDTAGIRETEDAVEQIGVHFAQERIQQSDLILAVFDASRPFSSEDRRIVEEVSKQPVPAIAVVHKTDLPAVLNETELGQGFQQVVHTSVENTQSLDLLQQAIQQVLHLVQLEEGAAVLANERQRSCVIRAKDHLSQAIAAFQAGYTLDAVTVDLTDGVSALLELTGEKASDAVVDEVFRNFCVGK